MSDITLDTSLAEVIEARFWHHLVDVGIFTLGDLAALIEQYGLAEWESGSYFFPDRNHKAPSPRHLGRKGWAAALTALSNAGFDWRQHTTSRWEARGKLYRQKPPIEIEIRDEIKKLIGLLEQYLEATQAEGDR